MKVIFREFQQDIYQDLVRILCVLAKVHTDEATDAIIDAFHIGQIVGVDKELESVTGIEVDDNYKSWTDYLGFKHAIDIVMGRRRA